MADGEAYSFAGAALRIIAGDFGNHFKIPDEGHRTKGSDVIGLCTEGATTHSDSVGASWGVKRLRAGRVGTAEVLPCGRKYGGNVDVDGDVIACRLLSIRCCET